jgi:GR25 family glycosyltransferase involved in LPS biosynthesis
MRLMPEIFVISPKEIPECRKMAVEHFAERGVEPVFFDGVYGKDMGLLSSLDDPKKPYSRLTPGKIALALNHWFLWQHVVMSRVPAAIIFEDDVVLPEDFQGVFLDRLAQTPEGWDIVYLGITFPERLEDSRIRTEKVNSFVWKHMGMNTFDGTVDGTWAYMVSLEGAKKLAAMRMVLDEPIDRWLALRALPSLNTYIWHPSPVKHRPPRV